jgi:hypothetical protein
MANLSISQGGDQAALDAAAGLNKAFGGSGFALQKSNLTNSQELGRATTEAGLRSNAFDKAAALAGTDAGLLTNTSQFNSGQANARATAQAGLDTGVSTTNSTEANKIAMANQDSQNQAIKNLLAGAGLTTNIGNSQAANDQNDVQAQLAAGGVQRGIDGDQRSADLNMLTAIRQLLGFDPSQFIGQSTNGNQNTDAHQTVTTTPSTLDTIGKIAGLAATAFGVPGGGGFQSLFNSGGGGGIPKFNGGVPTDNSFGDFG